MEHVVFWSAHSGTREFARVEDLPEAVELVERLRNRDGITDATVHSLTDVPVGFRTYYVAEVGAGLQGAEPDSAAFGPIDVSKGEPSMVPSVVPDSRPVALQAAVAEVEGMSGEALPVEGPPALSVVPDMLETSPDLDADSAQSSAEESKPAGVEGFPRSLGLFA